MALMRMTVRATSSIRLTQRDPGLGGIWTTTSEQFHATLRAPMTRVLGHKAGGRCEELPLRVKQLLTAECGPLAWVGISPVQRVFETSSDER